MFINTKHKPHKSYILYCFFHTNWLLSIILRHELSLCTSSVWKRDYLWGMRMTYLRQWNCYRVPKKHTMENSELRSPFQLNSRYSILDYYLFADRFIWKIWVVAKFHLHSFLSSTNNSKSCWETIFKLPSLNSSKMFDLEIFARNLIFKKA